MNRYGRMALEYTRDHLPRAFAEIEDPEVFFTDAGAEIETEIGQVREQLRGARRPGETQEQHRLRSSHSSRMAEELVLADQHLFTATPERDEPDTADDPVLADHYRDLAEVNAAIAKLYE